MNSPLTKEDCKIYDTVRNFVIDRENINADRLRSAVAGLKEDIRMEIGILNEIVFLKDTHIGEINGYKKSLLLIDKYLGAVIEVEGNDGN